MSNNGRTGAKNSLPRETSPLSRWEKMEQVSPRIKNLRKKLVDSIPEISIHRAELVTESYRKTFGQSAVLRRAKAMESVLENAGIFIHPGELIVGGLAEKPRAVPLFPEYDCRFLLDELDTFEERTADKFKIDSRTKSKLKDLLPFWEGNTLADQALELMPPAARESAKDLVFALTALRSGIGHIIIDYPSVLRKGMRGILEEVEALSDSLSVNDPEYTSKMQYYAGVRITGEAAITCAGRYADLALELASSEEDPARKQELNQISNICRTVPAQPAKTFREALQSLWFVHLFLQLESNGHSVSLGRFDQYMYPYYRDDLDSGAIDPDFAEELVHCLWIKLSEMNKVRDKVSSVAFGGYPMFQHLSLGGQTESGKSAVNELSHLCLEATAKVGMVQPSVSIRWYYSCPEDFLIHAIETASFGTGMPAFFNDEVLIPNMLQAGYKLEEARDYAIVGCTEPTVPGISEPWLTGGFINILKILERTIFNGYDPVTNRQTPFQTGNVESFDSFQDFIGAYSRQLDYYLRHQIMSDNILDTLHGKLAPTPFASLFIHDCLENGKTTLEGGARYNSTTINAVGIANVADSLAVIRKLIYEEGELSWPDLKDALRSNFEPAADIQAMLRNGAPKYGNDIEYVDALGAEINDLLRDKIAAYTSPRKGGYLNALYSIACHVLFADIVGASPDGRKKGEPLADGGVSCSQGRDSEGPTAMLSSVTKLDPYKAVGSTLLNLKFSPEIFRDRENCRRIADLVKTYFLSKGQHVQFNVIDAETLRAAQANPERYPSLVVRVAGFSVLFTTIDPLLQEDIITRTEIGG